MAYENEGMLKGKAVWEVREGGQMFIDVILFSFHFISF